MSFFISQHVPPILWSPLWNFACKFFRGKGLSLIMCYTDLNTIDLILKESSCQILYWWPTSDSIFEPKTSFLVAHPTSETILRIPGNFAAPVRTGGGQDAEKWGWEKAKNWNRAMREAVKAVQRGWKEWKMVDLPPGTWCSSPSCSLLSRNSHL